MPSQRNSDTGTDVEHKVFVVDIDNTICITEGAEYESATPIRSRIAIMNQLYDQGHEIHYFTARGSQTGIDWTEVTRNQLVSWGARFHSVRTGKPHADVYIDDKALLPHQMEELIRDSRDKVT